MMIRAILIDPFACTVDEVSFDGDSLAAFCALLSHPSMPVREISSLVLMPDVFSGDCAIVDGDGLNKMCERYWGVGGPNRPIAGKALLVAVDADGSLTSARSTIETVKKKVGFFKTPSDYDGRCVPTSAPWSGSTTRQ